MANIEKSEDVCRELRFFTADELKGFTGACEKVNLIIVYRHFI